MKEHKSKIKLILMFIPSIYIAISSANAVISIMNNPDAIVNRLNDAHSNAARIAILNNTFWDIAIPSFTVGLALGIWLVLLWGLNLARKMNQEPCSDPPIPPLESPPQKKRFR